ncbi:MAG: hypothetical protein WA876_02065 [Candidatus Acidiferrales bacterium]
MARTAEIVFLAVPVFVGSAVTMSLGALMAWEGIISYPNWTSPAGGFFGYYAMAASIIIIGLGGWGIASGVGILNTRQWARISTLIFGTISLLIAILGALEMFLDPRAGVSYMEGVYMGSVRPDMMALYGCLAAFGAFSLYFFNKKSVKSQFLG